MKEKSADLHKSGNGGRKIAMQLKMSVRKANKFPRITVGKLQENVKSGCVTKLPKPIPDNTSLTSDYLKAMPDRKPFLSVQLQT